MYETFSLDLSYFMILMRGQTSCDDVLNWLQLQSLHYPKTEKSKFCYTVAKKIVSHSFSHFSISSSKCRCWLLKVRNLSFLLCLTLYSTQLQVTFKFLRSFVEFFCEQIKAYTHLNQVFKLTHVCYNIFIKVYHDKIGSGNKNACNF